MPRPLSRLRKTRIAAGGPRSASTILGFAEAHATVVRVEPNPEPGDFPAVNAHTFRKDDGFDACDFHGGLRFGVSAFGGGDGEGPLCPVEVRTGAHPGLTAATWIRI